MNVMLLLGSVNMAVSVILGAFGAHALKKKLTADMLTVYQTGVQYHMIHALGLLIVGLIANSAPISPLVNITGWLLLVGIILFSGSLYALSLTGIRKLGAITPLGGLAFVAGWIVLAVAFIQG